MGERVSKFCDIKVKKGRTEKSCGRPVPDDIPTAVTIGTTRYLMDLCEEHQDALNDAVQPFISVAHDAQKRTGTQVRKALQGKRGAFTTADVRKWLQEQGREVSHTGRLPEDLLREYQDAHK
jgi:hypothetical protein